MDETKMVANPNIWEQLTELAKQVPIEDWKNFIGTKSFAEKEIKVHEHGFVRLVEVQGSDQSIENAARISYGTGTRKTSETRTLLRYLVRHKHTSPLEMGGVVFHIKCPIFVMRQLVRHRTASLNEYSARYSELSDDFYIPEPDYIKPQSVTNKQGRGGEFSEGFKEEVQLDMKECIDQSYATYKGLANTGLSRELARIVMPVAGYTECVWKINLHNFFHFATLRTDSHAQQEIQDFANAMVTLLEPHFPISFEAWRDYQKESRSLSRMEQVLLQDLVVATAHNGIRKGIAMVKEENPEDYEMSKREWDEFFGWYSSIILK